MDPGLLLHNLGTAHTALLVGKGECFLPGKRVGSTHDKVGATVLWEARKGAGDTTKTCVARTVLRPMRA